MNGPFGMPWLTFSALIVIVLSIVLAAVWAARSGNGEGDHE
jgi:hypothetical protein